MTSMVHSPPRSTWETLLGVTPVAWASWPGRGRAACVPGRAAARFGGLSGPCGAVRLLRARRRARCRRRGPTWCSWALAAFLRCPFLQVNLVELLGARNHPCVPLVPVARLVASDKQDRGAPGVEDEQDTDLAETAGTGPELLQVGDLR